jgi:long-subunit acyl-CoA synthetase (AMP-forming)
MQKNILKSEMPLGKFCPTVGQMLRERLEKYPQHVILKEKIGENFVPYRWFELYHEISLVGTSLLQMGLKKGDRVGVISRNRKEMLVLELAVMSVGGISTPVFSEYPHIQLEHTLGNAEPKFVVIDTREHLEEFFKTEVSQKVEKVFLMDYEGKLKGEMGKKVLPFEALYNMKTDISLFERAIDKVKTDDPCLIQYTSGTTGLPKGVVLIHKNIMSQRKAQEHLWDLGPSDRFLSYLPWHHSFGGIFERFTALYFSCTLAIDNSYGKDIPLLIKNFVTIKPTVYFSVPKIYQALVNECRHSKELEKEIFHPEIKFFFTAAAPLPKDIEEYITERGIPIVEGWGLTETAPCVTLTPLSGERYPYIVGKPIPGVQIKIADDGEILVKGPNVMKEYFRMPDKTKEVFTKDGWFRTGDLGEITPTGLLLRGRMDGIFKLSNGEKVFSQILEMQLVGGSDFIEQAVVIGSGEDFVSALIFPSFKNLEKWAKENGLKVEDRRKLVATKKVRDLFKREIHRINLSIYPHYSRIRCFVIVPDELSLLRGELTPSLKVVKPKVLENYAPLVDAIYHPERVSRTLQREVIRVEKKKEVEPEMKLT